MADESDSPKKEDLTGLFDLPAFEHPEEPEFSMDSGSEEVGSDVPFDEPLVTENWEEPHGSLTDSDSELNLDSEPSLDLSLPSEQNEESPGDPLTELEALVDPPVELASPSVSPTLDQVKAYSEKLSVGNPSVPAQFPFTLRITGPLRPEEKEKLLDLLQKEDIGLRELDLEPQLDSGRILIPRVSEYAGVLLVQALRNSQARLTLAPSDLEDEDQGIVQDGVILHTETRDHRGQADQLPMTQDAFLPDTPSFEILDVVTASAPLRSPHMEAEGSPQYQELLEDLIRELKQKAHRKGADAILNFEVSLTPLSLPSEYRLSVYGSAVQKRVSPSPESH